MATWLSVLVVFCTTYVLILPAVTLSYSCGLEEHQHTSDCYKEVIEERLATSSQSNEIDDENISTDFIETLALDNETQTNALSDDQSSHETVKIIHRVLTCKKPEHQHVSQCGETLEDIQKSWEANLPVKDQLSQDLNKRILEVAQSQQYYRPDTSNSLRLYDENDPENPKELYWNRYAALANPSDQYSQNSSNFINFVLHYVDESLYWNTDIERWMEKVEDPQNTTAFERVPLAQAKPGAIIFFEKENESNSQQEAEDFNSQGNESGFVQSTDSVQTTDLAGTTPADASSTDWNGQTEEATGFVEANQDSNLQDENSSNSPLNSTEQRNPQDQATPESSSMDVNELEIGFLTPEVQSEDMDNQGNTPSNPVSVLSSWSESKPAIKPIDQRKILYTYQIKSNYASSNQTNESDQDNDENTEDPADDPDDAENEDKDTETSFDSDLNQDLENESNPDNNNETPNGIEVEGNESGQPTDPVTNEDPSTTNPEDKTEPNETATPETTETSNGIAKGPSATDDINQAIQNEATLQVPNMNKANTLAVDAANQKSLTITYDLKLSQLNGNAMNDSNDIYGFTYTSIQPQAPENYVLSESEGTLIAPEPSSKEYWVYGNNGNVPNRAHVHYFRGWQINGKGKTYLPGDKIDFNYLEGQAQQDSVQLTAVWYNDKQHIYTDTAVFSINLNVNADIDYSCSYADTSNDTWVDGIYSTAVIGLNSTNVPRVTNDNYTGYGIQVNYRDENDVQRTTSSTYSATFLAYQSPGTYKYAFGNNSTTNFSITPGNNYGNKYTIEENDPTSTPELAHSKILELADTNGVTSKFVRTAAMLQDIGPDLYKASDGYTLRIGSYPEEDQIFAQLQNYQRNQINAKKKIHYGNGNTVNANDLTPENFEVIWYVFKLNQNDKWWHIDGKLVQRKSYITITKTFDDDGAASGAVDAIKKGNYTITVSDNINDGNATKQNLAKQLSLPSDDSISTVQYPKAEELSSSSDKAEVIGQKIDGNTYQWTIPVRSNETYTFREKNFIYDSKNSDLNVVTLAQYNTQNINGIEDNSSNSALTGLVTYPGKGNDNDQGVNIYTQSFSDYSDESAYQRLNFYNSYFDTETLPIYKIDSLSEGQAGGGNILPNAKFKLIRANGKPFDLYQKTVDEGSRKGLYLYPADVNESPENENGEALVKLTDNTFVTGNAPVFLKNFKSAKFAGTYILTEVEAPVGYELIGNTTGNISDISDSEMLKDSIVLHIDEAGNVTQLGKHEQTEWASDSSNDNKIALKIKNISEKLNIEIDKKWVNDSEKGNAVTVQLLQSFTDPNTVENVQPQGSPVGNGPIELMQSNGWSHTWENLPKYIGGSKVYYYVREASIMDKDGAVYSYSPNIDASDGFADYIVNYHYDGRATDSHGKITTAYWTISNQKDPGGVNLFKQDKTGTGLQGAKFNLYANNPNENPDQEAIRIITSEETTGLIHIPNLDDGTYYLQEFEAPAGYRLDQSIVYKLEVTGKRNGRPQYTLKKLAPTEEIEIPTLVIFNEKLTLNFPVTKIAKSGDGESGEILLSGAQFRFYKYTDFTFTKLVEDSNFNNTVVYESQQDGSIAIPTLEEGYYRLQEIAAPNGYTLPTETFDFHLYFGVGEQHFVVEPIGNENKAIFELTAPTTNGGNESKEYSLKVINTTGQKLPDTGGEGTNLYTSGGILLIAASCLLYTFSKKQPYRKGEQ